VAATKWLDFEESEYRRRVQVAQHAMGETGVSALFLTQRENVEYFSGFMTTHWGSRTFPTAGLVIPAVGELTLVVSDFLQETARSTSPFEIHATFSQPHSHPERFVDSVIESVKAAVPGVGVLGVETGYQLMGQWSISDFQAMKDRMPEIRFQDGDHVVWAVRSQKSEKEIERVEWLSQVTARAVTEVLVHAEPGMTEVDLARDLLLTVIEAGADGLKHLNIRSGLERYGMRDSLPQPRPIQTGEALLINAGASSMGYMSDVGSTRVIGDADLYRDDFETLAAAQAAGLAAAKVGATAGDVFSALHQQLERSELRSIAMCGHGMGLAFHEPPVLRPGNDEVLREGMLLGLESWLYDDERRATLCYKSPLVVDEGGSRFLAVV
jgi:Xaa-Pro aminopeptidase